MGQDSKSELSLVLTDADLRTPGAKACFLYMCKERGPLLARCEKGQGALSTWQTHIQGKQEGFELSASEAPRVRAPKSTRFSCGGEGRSDPMRLLQEKEKHLGPDLSRSSAKLRGSRWKCPEPMPLQFSVSLSDSFGLLPEMQGRRLMQEAPEPISDPTGLGQEGEGWKEASHSEGQGTH